MLRLHELLQELRDSGYVIKDIKGKYQFTPKFYEALEGKAETSSLLPVPGKTNALQAIKSMKPVEWEALFIRLISEAKVPQRLEDNRGGEYYANKFSQDGLKVFKKALESGVVYDVLVKSVMLYYKSNVRYKKAIGNYFKDGDWRSDYEALANVASTGEEALHKHIKQEVDNGSRSQYKLG